MAVIDDKTTPMCKSLHGQLFNVKGQNIFKRYSESAKGTVTFKCQGLVLGVNKPPITDHFHWCRSQLTYLIDRDELDIIKNELTGQEIQNALKRYISADSYKINEKLYNGIPLTPEDEQFIMDIDSALRALPKYKGTVYRTMKINSNKHLEQILSVFDNPSQIGSWKSYTSSSKEIYDDSFNLVLKIDSKTGRNLSKLNSEGGGEILFPRNTSFQLLNIKKENGKIYVRLEEI